MPSWVYFDIVMHMQIAKQRLGKYIPEANAFNNRAFFAQ
jgi:hypothetical protein